MNNDFRKFAVHHLGMNGLALDQYTSQVSDSYISPTIIEERKLNVAQMDVFSRLMMDRIIFLGTQVDDYTANVIQAQLLYLDSSEPGKMCRSTSILLVALFMQVSASTTLCNTFKVMYLLSAPVWLLQWRQCFSWQALKTRDLPSSTHA